MKCNFSAAIFLLCLLAACSSTNSSTSATYTVSFEVTDLGGYGLQLSLNGLETYVVPSSGTYTFLTTISGAYTVSVVSHPVCQHQYCTVTNGTGSANANVANVFVHCTTYSNPSLVAANWNNTLKSLFITDGILNLANLSTATPRTVSGSATTLSSLSAQMNTTVDSPRQLIYVNDGGTIKVFSNATSLTGNVAPTSSFSVVGASALYGVSIDAGKNRLYVGGNSGSTQNLYVLNHASSLTGTVTPDITVSTDGILPSIDDKSDRLYLTNGSGVIRVFDSASTLTSSSTANRSFTFSGYAGAGPQTTSIFADGCYNGLWITERNGSSGGNQLFLFSNASTLTGTIALDGGSTAHGALATAMNVSIDQNTNQLFAWSDSASSVSVWTSYQSLSGNMGAPNKVISGVANDAYGMAVLHQ